MTRTRHEPGTRAIRSRAVAWCCSGLMIAAWPVAAQSTTTVTPRGDTLIRERQAFTVRGVAQPGDHYTLRVPEHRATRGASASGATRWITLRWFRFPSTAVRPGAPIVFLAGGPGDAASRAFASMPVDVLDSLRAIGDVIAFDQRATGQSTPLLPCPPTGRAPAFDVPLRPAQRDSIAREAARACLMSLRARGIQVAGYTTAESAEDLESLRVAMDVPTLSLLGGSYGTHLGLAYVRRYPTHVSRVVLNGVEGPDDTFKRPEAVEATFVAVAALADADSARHNRDPLLVVFDRLRARLDSAPQRVTLGGAPVLITAWDLQRLVTDAVGDLRLLQTLPARLYAMDSGRFDDLGRAAANMRRPFTINGMNMLMDCASGASEARRKAIAAERQTARLGDVIDYPANAMCDTDGMPRLPDAFRAPALNHAAILFVSGTLDGRTPLSNVEALRSQYPNSRHLIIEFQSHSLMGDPDVLRVTRAFLRGEDVPDARVVRVPPLFTR